MGNINGHFNQILQPEFQVLEISSSSYDIISSYDIFIETLE